MLHQTASTFTFLFLMQLPTNLIYMCRPANELSDISAITEMDVTIMLLGGCRL